MASLFRIFSVIRKEFIQISRDPRTLAITFIMPIMLLFLLGYAATNDVRNVPLAVLDQSKSQQSRALLDAFRATDYFTLAYEVDSEKELARLIDGGQARTGLIIPPDYGDKTSRGQAVSVAFIIDGSDPTVAGGALSAATLLGQTQSVKLQVQQLSRQTMGGMPTTAGGCAVAGLVQPRYGQRLFHDPRHDRDDSPDDDDAADGGRHRARARARHHRAIDRDADSVVGIARRQTGALRGDRVRRRRWKFWCSERCGSMCRCAGTLGCYWGWRRLFVMTTLSIGLFISTIAHTQQEAMLTTFMTILPTIFLSGFFFPVAAMPQVLQWISAIIPLKYFLIIVRSIVLKGVGLQLLLSETVTLAVMGIVMMAVASSRFRKRLD